jgi:hypothetical protein
METDMDLLETCTIDYGTYKVVIKPLVNSKKFQTKVSMINTKYARREKMVEEGKVSKEFADKVESDKANDIAEIYTSDIIVSICDSKGKEIKDLKKFVKDPENGLMMGDIIDQALMESNFIKEQEVAESKNSVKS